MVRKTWIVIGGIAVLMAMVSAATYAEKSEMKEALPAAVQAAVKAMFPSAVIEKSKSEEMEIKTYEVELKGASMNVGEDGTVISAETVEDMNALPPAVAQTIKAQNGKVATVEKEVKYSELKLVKLDSPATTYEAKISKDGKEVEVAISADGKILKQQNAEKEEKDKKSEKHEKDEDEKD